MATPTAHPCSGCSCSAGRSSAPPAARWPRAAPPRALRLRILREEAAGAERLAPRLARLDVLPGAARPPALGPHRPLARPPAPAVVQPAVAARGLGPRRGP